jgi:hypothetical protein
MRRERDGSASRGNSGSKDQVRKRGSEKANRPGVLRPNAPKIRRDLALEGPAVQGARWPRARARKS